VVNEKNTVLWSRNRKYGISCFMAQNHIIYGPDVSRCMNFMKSIRAGKISTEVESAPAGQGGLKTDEACGGDLP